MNMMHPRRGYIVRTEKAGLYFFPPIHIFSSHHFSTLLPSSNSLLTNATFVLVNMEDPSTVLIAGLTLLPYLVLILAILTFLYRVSLPPLEARQARR